MNTPHLLKSFVADLADRGALRSRRAVLPELLRAGPTGLASLGANLVALVTAVFSVPFVAEALLVLNLACIAACIFVIVRKKKMRNSGSAQATSPRWRYASSHVVRLLAKVSLPVLVLCSVAIGYRLLPNIALGRSTFQGSLCSDPREQPMAGFTVDVLDGTGASVVAQTAETDDYGFFYLDLKPWARAPQTIQLHSDACPTSRFDLGNPVRAASTCSALPPQTLPQSSHGPVWRISCNK